MGWRLHVHEFSIEYRHDACAYGRDPGGGAIDYFYHRRACAARVTLGRMRSEGTVVGYRRSECVQYRHDLRRPGLALNGGMCVESSVALTARYPLMQLGRQTGSVDDSWPSPRVFHFHNTRCSC